MPKFSSVLHVAGSRPGATPAWSSRMRRADSSRRVLIENDSKPSNARRIFTAVSRTSIAAEPSTSLSFPPNRRSRIGSESSCRATTMACMRRRILTGTPTTIHLPIWLCRTSELLWWSSACESVAPGRANASLTTHWEMSCGGATPTARRTSPSSLTMSADPLVIRDACLITDPSGSSAPSDDSNASKTCSRLFI